MGAYLQRGQHFALLLAVDETVLVLHRDEWREVVRDCVVWDGVGQ